MGRRADDVEVMTTHVGQRCIVNDVGGDGYRGVLFEITDFGLVLMSDIGGPVELLTAGPDGKTEAKPMGGLVSVPIGRVKHIQEPD